MKILTFSTLFPNAVKPGHGIFVETRLRHLLASGQVEARVVAPVPWFPLHYTESRAVPRSEARNGIQVQHPRYPTLPKIGMNIAPALLAAGARASVARLLDEG